MKIELIPVNESNKDNGATNIRLLTKESNENAIGLYESFGFKNTGEIIDGENQFELNR